MKSFFRCLLLFIVLTESCGLALAEPPPSDAPSALDAEVLKVVIEDLLTQKDLFLPHDEQKTVILVHCRSGARLQAPDAGKGISITTAMWEADWKIPAEIQTSLLQRNSTDEMSLEAWTKEPGLAVEDLGRLRDRQMREKFPQARGYLTVHLPGYSPDQTQAVFQFSFGPAPHGAMAAYHLTKKDGRWTVLHRNFVFFT